MAIFGPSIITLTTGEKIVKSSVIGVTPLQGKEPAEGETDYRSYDLILNCGEHIEVFERNQSYASMITALGFLRHGNT